jgi:NAD(P)-dependent dehydrogenase (short-subunit alcohol dehydrogenase family)
LKLQGKVAIVTGGARGIGAGIARCLATEGATVAILDLDGPEAERTAASLGNGAIGLAADVAEEAAAKAAVDTVAARLGGLDILVNNAGGGRDIGSTAPQEGVGGLQGIEGHTQERWDEQLATNLRTTFAATKAAVPHLRARGAGSIINIASIAGLMPSTSITAYAAAKAGVISLTRSMALEYAAGHIRANAICPGFLWTRAWEGLARGMQMRVPQFANMEPRDIFLQVVANGVPLGREQTPEDIGKLAAFLCSDDARNITGQSISVDGGITLRGGG